MKNSNPSSLGGPEETCSTETRSIEKWIALDNIAVAAKHLGLNDRNISVLRALITFLPSKYISPAPLSATVFPSNNSLRMRLGGMPESTLRRHISKLVKSGLLVRHDSSNRKRFARRTGMGELIGFGFDLSKLALKQREIERYAIKTKENKSILRSLKHELAALNQKLSEKLGATEFVLGIKRLLRRQSSVEEITAKIAETNNKLTQSNTTESSANDDRNERHIQTESISKKENRHKLVAATTSEVGSNFFRKISEFTVYKDFYPADMTSWAQLADIVQKLSKMIGISDRDFSNSWMKLGKERMSYLILSIIESYDDLENPIGFFHYQSRNLISSD